MSSPDGFDDFGRRKRDGSRREDRDNGDRRRRGEESVRRSDSDRHHRHEDRRRNNDDNNYDDMSRSRRYDDRRDRNSRRDWDRNRDREHRSSRNRHDDAPSQRHNRSDRDDRDYSTDDQGRESDDGQRHGRRRSRSSSNDQYDRRRNERGDRRDDKDDYSDRSDDKDNSNSNNNSHRREESNHRDSSRQNQRPPHSSRGRKKFPEPPEIGAIVRGYVVRIESYGAFLEWQDDEIDDFYHRGLIHISEMSENRVGSVQDIVRIDDRIFARVVRVEQNRVNLSLRGLDIKTGDRIESQDNRMDNNDANRGRPSRDWNRGGPEGGGGGNLKRRAQQRNKLMQRISRDVSWIQQEDAKDADPSVLRLLYSSSPIGAGKDMTRNEKDAANKGRKKPKDSKSRRDDSSGSEDDSSASHSSSSEESRRRRKRRQKRSRSSRDRESSRRKRRRRYSSSSSSSDSSESSSSDDSSSSSSESEEERAPPKTSTNHEAESAEKGSSNRRVNFDTDPQSATLAPAADDSDDESVGPRPLQANAGSESDNLAAQNAAAGDYGGALLPGEGQAMAQFVQQNLRVPRRGEIGYGAEEIESWEKQGYVMSGSRHARMNAVRIRKENQVYSAEEQRALALITLEENQKKEAALMDDFRDMLEEKKRARDSAKK